MKTRTSMRTLTAKRLAVGILGALVVSLTGPLALGPALADGGGDFAANVNGTWITDPLPKPDWAPYGQQILMTIHADGTLQTSWSFEWGPYGLYGNSLLHGSWIQTGPLEMASRELCFVLTQNGEPDFVARFSNVYTFSTDFQTFTLDFLEEWFLLDQDPTDPDQEPVTTFAFPTFYGKKLDPPSALMNRAAGEGRDLHGSGPVDASAPNALSLRIVGSATESPTVELALPQSSAVHLDVFDVAGRHVRSLQDEPLAAGTHTFTWDGRTTAGKATGSGVYFVKARALDQTRTVKVVRSR